MKPPKIKLSTKLVIVISILCLFTISVVVITKRSSQEDVAVEQDVTLLPIRIKVLNGCGFNGLARKVSNSLNRDIVDVLDVGNTLHAIYNKSIIVVKTENEDDLKRLQKYTGINRFVYATNKFSDADFIIILGHDYEKYFK